MKQEKGFCQDFSPLKLTFDSIRNIDPGNFCTYKIDKKEAI